jgi:hypothetical protein
LALTVARDQLRVLLAALFLIVGMLVPPLLLAVANHLAILRVGSELLPVVIRSASALARGLTTDGLLRTINRRQK